MLILPLTVITVDDGTVFINDTMQITAKISPNLNLTSNIDVQRNYIQFDSYWFNVTSTSGRVYANITHWNSDLKTFYAQNTTLTDVVLKANVPQPQLVYLDGSRYGITDGYWNYSGGVISVSALTKRNITLSYVAEEGGSSGEGYAPITTIAMTTTEVEQPQTIIFGLPIETVITCILIVVVVIIIITILYEAENRRWIKRR